MLKSISKKQAGYRQNALSWIMTVGVLSGIYFFLQSMAVPGAFIQKDDDLDFLPLDIVNMQAFKQMDATFKPETREQAIDAVKTKSNSIPERIVEDELLKFFESSFSQNKIHPDLPTSTVDVKSSNPEIALNSNQSRLTSNLASTEVHSSDFYQIPKFENSDPGKVTDVNLTLGETSELKIVDTGYEPSQKPLTSLTEKKPLSPEVNVPIKKASELGDDYSNLSPIYRKLIEWMKKNPSQLTPVIKRFMGFRNGNLTSQTQITLSGRFFEIFLVCHEIQYEVRICIVEAGKSTLLIDKGFRRQSNYFRIGNASRDHSGRIFSFGTSQESPSDERTDEFYRIFLTWWEQVNSNENQSE
jgi:hypothetical protein